MTEQSNKKNGNHEEESNKTIYYSILTWIDLAGD